MDTTTTKTETRLLIGTETISGMPEYLRIVLHPVKVDTAGTIRNFDTSSFSAEPMADFRISASVDRTGELYGWDAEYHNVFSVDLRRAEMMVKQLRKVERGMEKLRGQWGYPPNFAQYVARVARIIGATGFGYRAGGDPRGWDYASGEYRWTDVDGMAYRIAQLVSDHQKTGA